MSTLGIILSGVVAVVCICLIIVVLMQGGRSAGLGAVGGSANSDSYWSKNKANSMEGTLSKYTKVLATIFMIVALVINFVR